MKKNDRLATIFIPEFEFRYSTKTMNEANELARVLFREIKKVISNSEILKKSNIKCVSKDYSLYHPTDNTQHSSYS